MRNSDLFLLCIGIGMVLFSSMLIHSSIQTRADLPLIEQESKVAGSLEITDLCLCTDATYARHPSQADRHTPFKDHPMSLEHFPAGSLIRAPR